MLNKARAPKERLPSDEAGGVASEGRSSARGKIIREPSPHDVESSTITALLRWLRIHRALSFEGYPDLWAWSVREPEAFWGALWDYFAVEAATPYEAVLRGSTFSDATWFPGARLNFAQHLLRFERAHPDQIAMISYREDGSRTDWRWSELGDSVRRFGTALRALGIKPGDRVAAYLPNIAEAAIAMIATTAIGAVWSSCSPEFGPGAAFDRLGQIEPKLLIASQHYLYAGSVRDRGAALATIVTGLPTLEQVVLVGESGWRPPAPDTNVTDWESLVGSVELPAEPFAFEQVPADHPLWIVYTSGTSGPPKAVVHSHAGALLGAMKDLSFHIEVKAGSRLFFYCTTSWVVWNLLLSGLSLGATVVLYDGSPFHPDIGQLWRILEDSDTTTFTTSPGFISKMIEHSYRPLGQHDVGRLETLVLAGAVAQDSVYEWLETALAPSTRVVSQAGSTEICGGYAGGVKLLPSRAGEITARVLGMDVDSLDEEDRPVRGKRGELIIRSPFPNAPRYLWTDPAGTHFRESYLTEFSGMWRQGDSIVIYDDGACRVMGRSDATIKRRGIRMGTNELYRVLSSLDEVSDAIAVCPQAGVFADELILFVMLAGATAIDDQLERRIVHAIAADLSPRHAPDRIIAAPAIPYMATGKRLEVPLRQLLEQRMAPELFAASLQHDLKTAQWYVTMAARGQRAD